MIRNQRRPVFLHEASPRYAGMIPWGETSGAPTYTSPRYAGMILENHLLKMVNLPSPRYAGMIPEAPGPMF